MTKKSNEPIPLIKNLRFSEKNLIPVKLINSRIISHLISKFFSITFSSKFNQFWRLQDDAESVRILSEIWHICFQCKFGISFDVANDNNSFKFALALFIQHSNMENSYCTNKNNFETSSLVQMYHTTNLPNGTTYKRNNFHHTRSDKTIRNVNILCTTFFIIWATWLRNVILR